MKKELICISCPVGCRLSVEADAKKQSITVTGNTCPRGIAYGKNEITDPKRMVTTTVRKKGGGTVSVKTSAPVPKAEVFFVLNRLKDTEIAGPVKTGDVIIKDIIENIDIVATQNA